MDLRSQRTVVTGAGGGIGRALTAELAAGGARLCLLESNQESAEGLRRDLGGRGASPLVFVCDISSTEQREAAWQGIEQEWGGVDVLINLAGLLGFERFQDSDPARVSRVIQVNLEAPIQLTRMVLPGMVARGHGRIVNVGSMFGSIGFPLFATYSATKFALRGFSQALRRELVGTGVGVTYVSPRAVRTPLNPPVIHEMAARGLMHMDEAEPVAHAIVEAIARDRKEAYIGFPESLFARINAFLPGVVDRALTKQVPTLASYASGQAKT
jgi:short-subunit dehydrogenase